MVKISLLPTEEKLSPGEKFLYFALTFGRYIIIVTELIVFSCFLARFKLDKELEDISDSIQKQQAVLVSFSQQEEKIRLLQAQIKSIKEIKKRPRDPQIFFQNLVSLLPPSVFLEEVEVKQNKLSLRATAYTSEDLGKFLARITLSEKFKNPALSQVVVEKGVIKFGLTAILTEKAFL